MRDGYCPSCVQTPCACSETVTVSKSALLHLVRKMDLDTEREVYPRLEVDLSELKSNFTAAELRSGDVEVRDEDHVDEIELLAFAAGFRSSAEGHNGECNEFTDGSLPLAAEDILKDDRVRDNLTRAIIASRRFFPESAEQDDDVPVENPGYTIVDMDDGPG